MSIKEISVWFDKFSDIILEFGLFRCQIDHFVFHRQTAAGYTLLEVYVDDITITGNDSHGTTRLKEFEGSEKT